MIRPGRPGTQDGRRAATLSANLGLGTRLLINAEPSRPVQRPSWRKTRLSDPELPESAGER